MHIVTDGIESRFDARAVIDASGTWTQPNPAGGLTGFRPDLSFLSEMRLELDPILQAPVRLAPEIDPNLHSCGTVSPHGAAELAHPDPGLYLVGMKSYGRAPTFLAITGYEQVPSVVAELVGDHEAAARVELRLPDTGVCGGAACTTNRPRTPGAAAAARPSRVRSRSSCPWPDCSCAGDPGRKRIS